MRSIGLPIEQASRRWRGGRRDDSARTRRELLISTQVDVVLRRRQGADAAVIYYEVAHARNYERAPRQLGDHPRDVRRIRCDAAAPEILHIRSITACNVIESRATILEVAPIARERAVTKRAAGYRVHFIAIPPCARSWVI